MSSPAYQDLQRRIEELKEHFVPAVKEDLTYTLQEYDSVRAFLVLAHAEIEEYIETLVKETISSHFKVWEDKGTASRVLMGLLAFRDGRLPEAETIRKNNPSAEGSLTGRVKLSVTSAYSAIASNHGIKPIHVEGLLLRVGVSATDLDQELLSELDRLGMVRGVVAHTSQLKATTTVPDPADTKGLVDGVVKKLLTLDELLIAQVPA